MSDGTDSADDMESSFFPDDGGIHDRDMQKEIDKEDAMKTDWMVVAIFYMCCANLGFIVGHIL